MPEARAPPLALSPQVTIVPSGLRAAKAFKLMPWVPVVPAARDEYWPMAWLGVSPLTLMVYVCAAMPLLSLAARVNW